MEIETLSAMSDGLYLNLIVIKVIVLITALLAIASFVIYLAGMAWLCFEETRRAAGARPAAGHASSPNTWSLETRTPDRRAPITFI